MKNSIKSKPKSPAIITTLSFPINTSWQRQEGDGSFLPLEVTSTFFPHSPSCFLPPKLRLFSKVRHCSPHSSTSGSKHQPRLLLPEISQGPTAAKRLCLLKAGLVFGKERRGERGEWEMLWVSTRTQATLFGQCLILWCG